MFKRVLSLLLVGSLFLFAICIGGCSNTNSKEEIILTETTNRKGTILTDANINNYVSFTIADEWPFVVTCNSKNKLFKFDGVSIELQVHSNSERNTRMSKKLDKPVLLYLDEEGNGVVKLERIGSSKDGYHVNVINVSGQVFD